MPARKPSRAPRKPSRPASGGGGAGAARAKALAENGHDVTIWAREGEPAAAINERHENGAYLPGVALPERLRQHRRSTPRTARGAVHRGAVAVHAADGRWCSPRRTSWRAYRRRTDQLSRPSAAEADRRDAQYLPGFYRGNPVYVRAEPRRRGVAGLTIISRRRASTGATPSACGAPQSQSLLVSRARR